MLYAKQFGIGATIELVGRFRFRSTSVAVGHVRRRELFAARRIASDVGLSRSKVDAPIGSVQSVIEGGVPRRDMEAMAVSSDAIE